MDGTKHPALPKVLYLGNCRIVYLGSCGTTKGLPVSTIGTCRASGLGSLKMRAIHDQKKACPKHFEPSVLV